MHRGIHEFNHAFLSIVSQKIHKGVMKNERG